MQHRATHSLSLVLVLTGAAALVGCGHATAELPPEAGVHVAPTALGPGDVFEVRVFGEQDLTGTHRVGSDGSINFPLVGRVEVAGRTAAEVSGLLEEKLGAYVRTPHVSLFVKEFNSKKVYVLGQVARPGTFPYEDGMNIIQAVTLAGGFGKMADQNGTLVTRIVDSRELRLKVAVKDIGEGQAPNFELKPGDIVYVPETIF